MREPPIRPALAPCLALLAGIVAARAGGATLLLPLAVAGTAASSGARPWRRRSVSAAFSALVSLVGALLFAHAEGLAHQRVDGWLPADGTPISTDLVGQVAELPEPLGSAEHRLSIDARPARVDSVCARIQLRVFASPETDGGALSSLLPGDLVTVFATVRAPRRSGDPLQADPRIALLSRGIDATGSVKSPRLVVRSGTGRPGIARCAAAVKRCARERLARAMEGNERTRAVVAAMLLGDQGALAAEDARDLRSSGLVHLLSISGLHVGAIVAALLFLLRRSGVGPCGSLLAIAAAVLALAVLTGGSPPVVRAALSAVLLFAGRAIGRDGDALNSLAVVTLALSATAPHLVFNPSFELTLLATAGILAFARPIAARVPLPRLVASSIGISSGAYLGAAPVVMVHFGRAAPISLAANLVAGGFCGVVLAAGALALAFGGTLAGRIAGDLAAWCTDGMLGFAHAASSVPGGSFRVGSPGGGLLLAYYALLHRRSAAPGRSVGEPLAIVLLLALMHLGPMPAGARDDAMVGVLDVGQGQAVALRGPDGRFLLVDAGGTGGGRFDAGERIVGPFLAAFGCRRIEALLVTHAHEDHAGGASAILADFEVGELWLGPGELHDARMRALAALARSRGTAIVLAERGARSLRAGFELRVLHPTRDDTGLDENDRSIVLSATGAGATILVPGDLSEELEARLVHGRDLPRIAMLVAGHHGAATSSSSAFLDCLEPRVAIVSVGAGNRFGHPSERTLSRLMACGARVYRTDLDGRTLVFLRGGRVTVESAFRRCELEPE